MSAEVNPGAGDFSPRARLLTVLINYIPVLHVASLVGTGFAVPGEWPLRFVAVIAALYLPPPVIYRLLVRLAPIRRTRIPVGSRDFLVWWAGHQLQVVFCRFAAAEEGLRLMPGLYSGWLRLWGAQIGKLTYWTAGTVILDRAYLKIGDHVTFGAGVRLNGHVLARNAKGELELILAPVVVGAGALVGGYSLLTAGTEVEPGAVTRAFLVSPPFSVWRDNRRVSRDEHA